MVTPPSSPSPAPEPPAVSPSPEPRAPRRRGTAGLPAGRLRLLVAGALLVLVSGVTVHRGLGLARDGFVPGAGAAVGEGRWYDWAAGSPELRGAVRASVLAAVGEAGEARAPAASGETTAPAPLWLLAPPSTFPPLEWYRIAALYGVPAVPVVGVSAVGGEPIPAGVRSVEVRTGQVAAPRPAVPLPLAALGLGLLTAVGALWLRSVRPPGLGPAARLALAPVVGTTAVVPVLALLLVLGLPTGSGAVVGAAAAAIFPVLLLGRGSGRARRRRATSPRTAGGDTASAAAPPSPLRRLAAPVLLAALPAAVAAAKILAAPLWSWDHFAVWGIKARRIAAAGGLDADFLRAAETSEAVALGGPVYPLGLPLAWLAAAWGALPGQALFVLFHLVFAAALVALVWSAARQGGASPWASAAAAALVGASPLLWDTESLGLADLPLALWSVSAVVLALAARHAESSSGVGSGAAGSPAGRDGGALVRLLAGAVLGFVPWLKDEGAPLAGLLLAALLLPPALASRAPRAMRVRRLAQVAVPALVLGVAAWPLGRPYGAEGNIFFADGLERLPDRLPLVPELLAAMAADLGRDAWLGGWIVCSAVLAVAAYAAAAGRRRAGGGEPPPFRWQGLLLGAVVLAQLTLYAAIYLLTWLDPVAHLASSFFRIAAALLPPAVVAAALAAAGPRRVAAQHGRGHPEGAEGAGPASR